MSDDEHYSDSDSENNSDIDIENTKKPIFKPSSALKSFSTNTIINKEVEDSDIDDADIDAEDDDDIEDEEEEEEQVGGGEEDEEEEEISDSENEDSDLELDENGEPIEKNKIAKNAKISKTKKAPFIIQDDEDEEDEYDENYLQKFDNELIKNYITEFHPECLNHNYDEISHLSIVIKNENGIIIDPLHKTIPYLTKYEKARILGQRSKQIENGAKPFVKVAENIVEAYIIAELELKEKKIPFIIRRPIPGGGSEYWKLQDLEIISF